MYIMARQKMTFEYFITKAKEIHGDKLIKDKTELLEIINKHGKKR